MKRKIIRSAGDLDSLREGEVGVVKKGTLKFEVVEEHLKAKQKIKV